uniref:Uncharacterized protein n=1 Tax=Romanomermis culicivorax TaxID=13658 RepID=A0A915KL17_ROMCU
MSKEEHIATEEQRPASLHGAGDEQLEERQVLWLAMGVNGDMRKPRRQIQIKGLQMKRKLKQSITTLDFLRITCVFLYNTRKKR